VPLTTVKEKNGISVVTDGTLKYLSKTNLAKLLKTTSAVLDPRVAAAPNSPITAIDTVDYVSETRLPGLLSYLTRLPTPIVVSNEALSSLKKLSQNSFKLESLLGLEATAPSQAATAPSQAATAPGTTSAAIDLESVDDRVAALIQAGSGITKVYDDLANTLTISATAVSGGGTAQVTSPAAFLTSNPTPGASAFIRQVGGSQPSVSGYKEAQGNLGWDDVNVNLLKLFYDGVSFWYSVFGEVAPTTAPAAIQTLSNFRTNVAGTQLLFDNSGTALTAFAGNINVAGTNRALTFVSATAASFTPAVTAGQALTVTLSSTTPALPVAVSALPVTNSVAATGLAKRTIAWANPPVVTVTGDVASFAGAGASVVTPIDTTQPFEILFRSTSEGDVFLLDDTTKASFSWPPPASERIAGVFVYGGGTQLVSATQTEGFVATGNQSVATSFFKFRKSGNDIILSSSSNGTNAYVDAHTYVGVLTGVPTLYGSVYNVGSNAIDTPTVIYYA
jgi:hypothetical protein